MNNLVCIMAPKLLKKTAKCQKGHGMEGIYSHRLMNDERFLWGTTEQIYKKIGLVQKGGL